MENGMISKEQFNKSNSIKDISGDSEFADKNSSEENENGLPNANDSSILYSNASTSVYFTSSPSPLEEGQLLRSTSSTFSEELCTLFNRITYLGSASISDPKNEIEIQKNIVILNGQSSNHAIEITLSIPSHSEGCVILYEPNSICEITSFALQQIQFCTRGSQHNGSHCFAFTHSHSAIAESAIYQCHVFKCDVPEAVCKVLQCFALAFNRVPKLLSHRSESLTSESLNSLKDYEHTFVFEAILDVKEEDSKGNFTSCPRDKDYFKLRCMLEKNITVTIQQICKNDELTIERCFGLLVSPGKNVKHSDMQLIEMVSFNKSIVCGKTLTQITGHWNPNELPFDVLNKETPRDTRVYMTVAADLVIKGITEPVRFVIETKAKVLPQNERFWYFSKKTHAEKFYLRLKETESESTTEYTYNVVDVYNASQLQQKRSSLSLNLKQRNKSGSEKLPSNGLEQESDSESDEPLLSGTGEVNKDCTKEELAGWADVLSTWRQNLKQRPKQLASLVQRGIPEALRGEVWQLLAGCHDDQEIVELYKKLITQNSSCENAIQRDINRTFPAHEFFRENGGTGQEALYRICKAYSVYDKEIGYCQGLSFLVAALLLHMPEEQAFSVLMKIMFDYHLRDFFRDSFAELHLKFYQLERLIEEQLPDLYSHFVNLGVEAHMFGSQWFLTLFTAKFPLSVVFYILDLFLLNEMDTIFQVSLALLMLSKKELLTLDFEGVLKHFRVALPKKYRSEESAQYLLHCAVGVKIKKLKKYEKDYFILKEQEKLKEDPLERLKNENKYLRESNIRLEQENDDLAHELLTCKINLRNDLDVAEDKAETLGNELLNAKTSLVDVESEKKRLEEEVVQLKEMCRRELERAESEVARSNVIIADYKQICSQLSKRLEKEQTTGRETIEAIMETIKMCEKCSDKLKEQNLMRTSDRKKKANLEDKLLQLQELQDHVKELEIELAQTKLALVESECKNQDLNHQLNTAIAELQASKNTWFHKTLSSIRDATRKDHVTNQEEKDKDSF